MSVNISPGIVRSFAVGQRLLRARCEAVRNPRYAGRHIVVVEERGRCVVKDFSSEQDSLNYWNGLSLDERGRALRMPRRDPNAIYMGV